MVEATAPKAAEEPAAAEPQPSAPATKPGQSVDIEKQMAAYYAKQLVHGRTLFSYERDNLIREGDTVIFYEKHDLMK